MSARVVHVVLGKANPERMNGVNRIVHELGSAQLALGDAPEVWGLTDSPDAPTPPRPYPLVLFRRSGCRVALPRELARALDGLSTGSVLHLHGGLLPELAALARAARRRGLAYVLTPHGAYARHALARRALRKRLYIALVERPLAEAARAVQVNSGPERDAALALAPGANVVVLPNGTSIATEVASALPSPLSPARTDLAPRIGFCGRLDASHKGLDLLLEGFAHYANQGGTGSLHLAGDGPDREQLRVRASRLGLGARVHFPGALFDAERRAFVAGLHLFVHTSRHEGMPMAVLEAAALARPLLLSRATNLASEALQHGAALLAEPNDPMTIAARLREAEALHRTGDLIALGQAAERMVREDFCWPRIAARARESLYGIAAPRELADAGAHPAPAAPLPVPNAERSPR